MGKISIEEAKFRLQDSETMSSMENEMITESLNRRTVKKKKIDKIEFIESIDDNLVIFKKNKTYILSPTDDMLNPIIGEFDEIPKDKSMPPCMRDWLDTYSKEVNYFQENEDSLLTEYAMEELSTDADGDTYGAIELIDLGLSVKWANMNIGASTIEDAGNYYAWGETEVKNEYTYKDIGNSIANTDYDIAHKLNQDLCMPSIEQINELINKCSWSEIKLNNINGWEVKGPNGNSIFMPITPITEYKSEDTHYCYIWSSENDKSNLQQAQCLKITPNNICITSINKGTGISIRAVASNLIHNSIQIENHTINNKKTINPLIPYKWGQTAPYNNECPIDPSTNKRCMTGCTQTALAMVLAYYANIGINGKKFKRGMSRIPSYISSRTKPSITLPALDPIGTFDWDNMNFIKASDFKTPESKKAVAELMKYLGHANKASYSSLGTGATPNNAVITAKSKMHFGEGAKLIYASSGLKEFKEQIYKELEAGYPVHFSGWNNEGKSGHAFICDGYNAVTDKFHFNWGWNGSYDGWFDIAILQPSSSNDFSYSKRCIIGLHPDYIFGDINKNNEVNLQDLIDLVQAIVDKKAYDYKMDVNSDGKVDETDILGLVNYIMGKKI